MYNDWFTHVCQLLKHRRHVLNRIAQNARAQKLCYRAKETCYMDKKVIIV